MHVDYLSNHPRERLDELAEELARLRSYRNRREHYCRQLEAELREIDRRKPILKRWFNIPTTDERSQLQRMVEVEHRLQDVDRQLEQLGHDVEAQRAGVHGEESFVATLRLLCPDDAVTLLCGYRNRKGEVDAVLVAPSGVWLVEVKNQNVALEVDGTRWTVIRVDNWGNVKDRSPATDRAGRSWARQVLEPARDLERWLNRKGLDVTIRTAVMLVHDRATITTVETAEVDLVSTRPEVLIDAVTTAAPALSDAQRQLAVELVKQDHDRQESRRRKTDRSQTVVLGADPER